MYDKEKLLEILSYTNFRTIRDDGRPYPPSAEIYHTISNRMKEFNINITPKHIYVIINENRNGFRDQILKAFNIEIINTETSYNVSTSSTEAIESSSINTVTKKFDLIVSNEEWKTIMPTRKLYGRRYKYVLQSGWTDVISEKAWQQQKFSCTIVFKKHDVHESSSANYYISIHGICKECNSIITGKIIHRPRDNVDVKIHFTALHVIEEKHSYKKKRQLRGKRRKMISSALMDKKLDAITFRRQEAKRLKDFGDIEPSIIPSAAVLRKAKEQALKERYGFLYTDSVLNILDSAKHGKYYGYIRSIGLLEFFCIYWSAEQQTLYKNRRKKGPAGFMTIDATGGVIKRNSDSEPPIFLYQCMYVNHDGSIPVFQMVSADHKAMHIAYFLQKIISAGNEPPRMVVCDFGWAILIAVAQVFGKCIDFRHYLRKCFNIVNGNNDTLPSCFIRLDVSHFVSMIARWNCLKGKDKLLVKKFYLRSLCQAYKMTSFEDLCLFCEAILVVALSQYVGSNETGEELSSELHLRYLQNLIKYVPEPEAFDDRDKNYDHETDCPEATAIDMSDWFQWTASIYENAQQIAGNCTEGTAINACYNPDLAVVMKTYLIPYVALWSGVMRPHFQLGKEIATSTSVEAEFADLKHHAFKGQLPIKADKFIHEHLNYIDGKIKLASCEKDIVSEDDDQHDTVTHCYSSASYAKTDHSLSVDNCVYSDNNTCDTTKNVEISKENLTPNTSDVVDDTEQFDCNIRENWRGLLRKSPQEQCLTVKPRRKPTYLDKCPEWDYVKSARHQNIPVMQNGNVTTPVNINGKNIITTETCAFDAILHLFASSIALVTSYKNKIQHLENRTLQLALSILRSGKLTKNHYTERTRILIDLPLFRTALTTYTTNISKLNANCNVAHLATYTFENAPSCQAFIMCSCGYLRRRKNIDIKVNIDMILYNGLNYIQEAIDDALVTEVKCKKCSNNVTENIEYGPHIFIDTSVFTDDGYIKPEKKITHTLGEIATDIRLNSQTYTLTGVIQYIKASDESLNNGHYIAYARYGSHWYNYDDAKKKRSIVTAKTTITPHMILYVIAST